MTEGFLCILSKESNYRADPLLIYLIAEAYSVSVVNVTTNYPLIENSPWVCSVPFAVGI